MPARLSLLPAKSLYVRYDDPILETIAHSIYTFFPRCMRCGEAIDSFEEADIRILTNRVVHRAGCATREEGRGGGARTDVIRRSEAPTMRRDSAE